MRQPVRYWDNVALLKMALPVHIPYADSVLPSEKVWRAIKLFPLTIPLTFNKEV